ncbi:hypothetical protein H5410_028971 [Solanum commersonii]|uniref:Uncharacterized protein n=1 Tax=Solanum commersonii TaxID=4109 RepID=A0A9J5Z6F5_SOLCO|nr:hypothetical protein H5410_028971 [Solanum commersonii]
MKPPTSPSKGKSVGNFLSMGLELLKGKKCYSGAASPLTPDIMESVHHLRILHNKLLQWRYINTRADSVHHNSVDKLSICLGLSNENETICGTKEVVATEEKHGNEIEFCSLFSNKVTRSMWFYGKAAFFSNVKFPRLFTIRSL